MDESNNETNVPSSKQDVLHSSQHEISSPPNNNLPPKPCTKDRHLQKSCPVCLKMMKSDKINRQLKTHNLAKSKVFMVSCNICEKVMRKNHL